MNDEKLNILVSPLGWGLGHATRIIPIIVELDKAGHKVTIATNSELGEIIKESCPNVKLIEFYTPVTKLGSGSSTFFWIAWYLLTLPITIIWENHRLKQLLKQNPIDLLISDNRYGFRSPNIPSVIITHQLRVIPPKPFGFLMSIGEKVIKRLLSKFDEVWIPDFEGSQSLAGILSATNGLSNLRYIGPISRFSYFKNESEPKSEFEVVAVATGPIHQRRTFSNLIEETLSGIDVKCLLVEGITSGKSRQIGNLQIAPTLNQRELYATLRGANIVITRSGYSSIMDLITLEKKTILIPTPGQTEQEYLAQRLGDFGWFKILNEAEAKENLSELLFRGEIPTPPKIDSKPNLENVIRQMLKKNREA